MSEKPHHCYGNMDWVLKYPQGKEPYTSICSCVYVKSCLKVTRENAEKKVEEIT